MIRTVVKILRKHLDQGVDEFNQENDMLSLVTNYNVLAQAPDYKELRLLARELISSIGDVKTADLITVPSEEELRSVLHDVLPHDAYLDDIAEYAAKKMHEWLVHDRPVDTEGGHRRGYYVRWIAEAQAAGRDHDAAVLVDLMEGNKVS